MCKFIIESMAGFFLLYSAISKAQLLSYVLWVAALVVLLQRRKQANLFMVFLMSIIILYQY